MKNVRFFHVFVVLYKDDVQLTSIGHKKKLHK